MKNNLKVLRATHNLTQESLAEKLGTHRGRPLSLENGKYEPSIGLAFKAAKLFKVKIEDIFYPGESSRV